MRLLIPCTDCLREAGQPDMWFGQAEFRDDGRYQVHCRRGHHTVLILQQEKYEVLFEIGVNAIIDGYYREAVASFAASLERFYEYAIGVMLDDWRVEREQALSTWKLVSSQSERQLGGFVFLWLSRFKEIPSVLPQGLVKLRNEVVHKGRLPSRDEAISFGDSVLAVTYPKLARMRVDMAESMRRSMLSTLRERSSAARTEVPVSTISIRTVFQASEPDSGPIAIAAYLAQTQQWRAAIASAAAYFEAQGKFPPSTV